MNAPVAVQATEDAQENAQGTHGPSRWTKSTSAIRISTRTTPGSRISRACGGKIRCTYTENGMYGSYWSVTRYKDIMQVDTSQKVFSSDAMLGGIVIRDIPMDFRRPSFIAMDPPKHDEQRKVVAPIVAPMNLQKLAGTIRERAARILDGLPRGETFDWVDRVSIELTTQMLATLFDFPFEERRTLTYWSNVATVNTRAGTEIEFRSRSATRYCKRCWSISPRCGTSGRSSRRGPT